MSDYVRFAEDVLRHDGPGVSEAEHGSRVQSLAADLQLTVETWVAANPVTPTVKCEECDGTGKVLDAPNRVLDGVSYLSTCEECKGSGRLPTG